MTSNAVRVIYAVNTEQGRVFLGFSDSSCCTVSAEELSFAGIFQADLEALGFVPRRTLTVTASSQLPPTRVPG